MSDKGSCLPSITLHLDRATDKNNNEYETSFVLDPIHRLDDGCRKQVRFADEEGQELCKVLEVCDALHEDGQLSVIASHAPSPAYLGHSRLVLPRKRGMRMLHCLEGKSNVREAVEKSMVCLESAACSSTFVFGVIAVKNVPYDKTVTVRYSFDKWKSLREIVAQFFLRDELGSLDRYFFVLDLKRRPYKSMPLEVAVKYTTSRTEYWDNNRGKNYKFDVQSLVAEERKCARTEMLF